VHIVTLRQLRYTTAPGTLKPGIDIPAGTKAEVPDAVGAVMVECCEAEEVSNPNPPMPVSSAGQPEEPKPANDLEE
jgi:hypothetical protein